MFSKVGISFGGNRAIHFTSTCSGPEKKSASDKAWRRRNDSLLPLTCKV